MRQVTAWLLAASLARWCTGCVAAPFAAPSDAPGICSEGEPGFASYAYYCHGGDVYVCLDAAGTTSMCDQAASAIKACGCATLTTCGTVQDANGAGAVACVKVLK